MMNLNNYILVVKYLNYFMKTTVNSIKDNKMNIIIVFLVKFTININKYLMLIMKVYKK